MRPNGSRSASPSRIRPTSASVNPRTLARSSSSRAGAVPGTPRSRTRRSHSESNVCSSLAISRSTMARTLAATRAWKRFTPSSSATTSASRKSRTAASSSRAVGRSCTSGALGQVEQLELGLGRPPPEARELDALHTGEERLHLHDADDPPLEVAEHLPPADGGRIHPPASGAFVRRKEAGAVGESAGGHCIGAEPPRAHAEPAEVLHRVADVHHLPVDHGAQALGAEDDVAHPVVAVHQRPALRRRQPSREPAERELESGVRLGGEG